MSLYARITREVREGPTGSKIGALFDLDQTLLAGFSAASRRSDILFCDIRRSARTLVELMIIHPTPYWSLLNMLTVCSRRKRCAAFVATLLMISCLRNDSMHFKMP